MSPVSVAPVTGSSENRESGPCTGRIAAVDSYNGCRMANIIKALAVLAVWKKGITQIRMLSLIL